MRILLTDHVARQHGSAIRAACADAQLVIAAPTLEEMDVALAASVEAAFWSVDLMGAANKARPPERLQAFMQCLETAEHLRWLHVCSSGSDRPILQRLMRRGVTVTTSAGANAMAVAHSATAGLLAMARGVPHWIESRQARRWAPLPGRELPPDLTTQRALVVGTGQVGSALARMLRALGLHVTGARRVPLPHPDFDAVVALSDLPVEVSQLDWLLLACPLSSLTHRLVDARMLAAMKPDAGLINVSRGEVVDEAALFSALQAGHLRGVYSDVAVDEPPGPDSPWWTAPRVLVSAHSGGLSTGFAPRTVAMFLDNLRCLTSGRPLQQVAAPIPDT
jgi:phosphoglycerate dehydrogenase-like enzyme